MKEKGRVARFVRELRLFEKKVPFTAQFITNAITNSIKMSLGVSLNKYRSGHVAFYDLFCTLVTHIRAGQTRRYVINEIYTYTRMNDKYVKKRERERENEKQSKTYINNKKESLCIRRVYKLTDLSQINRSPRIGMSEYSSTPWKTLSQRQVFQTLRYSPRQVHIIIFSTPRLAISAAQFTFDAKVRVSLMAFINFVIAY